MSSGFIVAAASRSAMAMARTSCRNGGATTATTTTTATTATVRSFGVLSSSRPMMGSSTSNLLASSAPCQKNNYYNIVNDKNNYMVSSSPLEFYRSTSSTVSSTRRWFASGGGEEEADSPAAELRKLLVREADEELYNGSEPMPAELKSLKQKVEKNWRIVEQDASIRLFLKDSSGGPKVAVRIHCQDTMDDMAQQSEDDDVEPSPPFRFVTVVTKAGKSLLLNCIAESADVYVEGLSISNDDVNAILSGKAAEQDDSYQGPVFSELAEDVQEAFNDYLGTIIDDDVAAFLPMYADYREQQLYVQFLQQAQSIIE